jgi:uncharacterized protein (TIGR03435 family)
MCLWLIVGAIMLIRLAASWILLGRFCARASDPPEALRTRAAHWLALCGSKRRNVRVVCSTETAIPAAVGPLRPAIVIPARLLNELDENALDQIGLHEAAHLARRDDYALAVQRILEALFAPHPVVRWIARRIDLEREIACDDFVLAAKGQSKSYAWCLTRMAELTVGASPSPAAAAATSNLARRVDMLLDKTRHTGTRVLRARLAVVIAALAALVWVAGRSPSLLAFAAPSPAFEVASVKPAKPPAGQHVGIFNYPGGRISVSQLTLEMLMSEAFRVEAFQISGGPGWIRKDRYDIEAKPPASSKSGMSRPTNRGTPLNEEQRQMLRALLTDRFQLKVHREIKQGPVYLLVRGKSALKLEAPKDKESLSWAGSADGGPIMGDGIAGINISMPELATRLSGFLGRPVFDRTGLKGSFDFEFKDAAADSVTPVVGGLPAGGPKTGELLADDPDARLMYAILMSVNGIGLRLDQGKGPVETIAIDHVEKLSEN